MATLVPDYYVLLRSLLRAKPHLRACLKRCRHCRIFLLTHPRNAGRPVLRCAFGCRQAHRRQESIRRSVEYYRVGDGPDFKRRQNDKRRTRNLDPLQADRLLRSTDHEILVPDAEDPEPPCPPSVAEVLPKVMDPEVVAHVQMVCSLIEGRQVARGEVLEMLAKVLRQLSIGRERKIDHTVAWLNANPP